jgi:hypothetical protein
MHTYSQGSPRDPVSEYAISGLEAMIAGTLALMSAYAHGACRAHQHLISGKIQSNLCCLQAQNALSPEFRKVLAQVGSSWHQHQLLCSGDSVSAHRPSEQSFSVAEHRVVQ